MWVSMFVAVYWLEIIKFILKMFGLKWGCIKSYGIGWEKSIENFVVGGFSTDHYSVFLFARIVRFVNVLVAVRLVVFW